MTSMKEQQSFNTTYTTAKVHNSQVIDGLMIGNEFLEANGIKQKFNEKGVRGKPLTPFQKEQNKIKSITRARVEHPFARIKTKYGNYKVIPKNRHNPLNIYLFLY